MKTYSWKYRLSSALATGVIVAAFLAQGRNPPPEARARAVCRGEILKIVKFPETVEFGQYSVRQTDTGGWAVWREFSAKNPLGVRKTASRTCVMDAAFSIVQ